MFAYNFTTTFIDYGPILPDLSIVIIDLIFIYF